MKISYICRFLLVIACGLFLPAKLRATDIVWTNLNGSVWSSPTNWSPRQVPGAADNVYITNSGNYTVNMDVFTASSTTLTLGGASGTQTLAVATATLTLTGSGVVNANGVLLLNGGTLTGPGSCTVGGALNWMSGTIALTNTTINGLATLSGSAGKSLYGMFVNNSIVNWSAGPLYCYSSAVLSNAPGAFINETFAGSVYLQNGSPWFVNAGEFNVSAGTGVATVTVSFTNTGAVNIHSGTLRLQGWGVTTATGSFVVDGGGQLDFSGFTYDLAPGSSVTGPGNFSVSNGTVNDYGTFNVGGTNTFNFGTANFLGAYTISGNTVNIPGGTANFVPGGTLAPGVLNLTGGTLGASNTVMVSGPTTWTSGTIQGNSLVSPLGGLIMSGTGGKTLLGCTLVNSATVTWSGGPFYVYGSSVISNTPNGTINETFAGNVYLQSGSPVFVNAGQLNLAAGAGGLAGISVVFSNTGTVSLQSGTLSVSGGGNTTGTGSFSVAAGAQLDFAGLPYNLAPGSSVTGAGNFSVSGGIVNEYGTFNISGTNTFNFGTANFLGAYTINGNTVNIPAGTANFVPGGTFAPGVLNITGGTLGASNTITVSGPTFWSSGTIQGNSTISLTGGLTVNGFGAKSLTGCLLVNTGTTTWSGGAFYFYGSAIFSNAPSGTFNETFPGTIYLQSGTPRVDNAGQFSVSAGSGGIATVGVPFNNSGTVEVLSGTLDVTALYDQTGGLTLLNGGNIQNNLPLEIQAGMLAGNGAVYGSVTNNGAVSPGMSPGAISLGQNYAQTPNGTLEIELAGTVPGTGFDLLTVTNTAILGGTLAVTLTNGFYPATNALFTFLNAGARSNTFANFYYPSNLVGLQVVYTSNSASVVVANVRPVISPVPDQNIPETVPFTLTATATDADQPSQTLSWSLISGPAGVTLSPAGVLNWTPDQTQSPSTNTVSIRVTDSGTPNLSVTNTFLITVYEVNIAPTLPGISTQTVDELTRLTVTNTANESNIHAATSGYLLLSAPPGMDIDTNGIITWTPTQLQSPSTNLVSIVVTNTDIYDLTNTHLSATNSFTVIVREVNVSPVLPVIAIQTVNALAPLTVTNTATESNIHSTLGYSLLSAPAGVSINNSGIINWTPARAQGPGTNLITTVVTNTDVYDPVHPHLSATNSFTVIVYAPTLGAVSNQTANVGQTFTLTNSATDNDPTRTLTFSLGVAPVGASITSAGGVFKWLVPAARAGSSNYVQLVVTDNSVPPLTDTQAFAILVNPIAPVILTPVSYANGHFTLRVDGSVGPEYILQASGDFANWTNIGTNTPAVLPFNFTDPRIGSTNQFYRALLGP